MNNSHSQKNKTIKLIKSKFFKGLLASGLVVVSGISHSEDTEIFTGVIEGDADGVSQNPDFFPNLLFILDNSTSMGSTEPILTRIVSTEEPDDPDDPDDNIDCNVDLVNFDPDDDYSFGSNVDDSNIYIYRGDTFTGKVVSSEQNQCQAYRDIIVNGNRNPPIFQNRLIQWGLIDGSSTIRRWDGNIDNLDTDPASGVECGRDRPNARRNRVGHGHNTLNTGDRNPRNWPPRETLASIGEYYFSDASLGNDPYANSERVSWIPGNYHRFRQLQETGGAGLPAACSGGTAAAPKTGTSVLKTFNPFDDDKPVGTETNPELATGVDQICGGPNIEDRNAATGRSQLPQNANLGDSNIELYKNRYYKIQDDTNPALFNVYRCQTRLDIMKDALTNVLEGQERINAGLMRFNANNGATGTNGGSVIAAILPMNDADNKKALIEKVDDLEFGNATPLAESLYEAYRYFRGLSIDQGRRSPGRWNQGHASFETDFLNPQLLNRTPFETDPAARNNNNYKSPINTQCQANNIILLSDGEPSNDTNRNSKIRGLAGGNCSSCSDEIAGYMKNNDIAAAPGINSGVNTFTIGLNLDSQTLRNISNAGGPDGVISNFSVSNTAGLELAFRSILGQIESTDADVFSAPAVTVNAFNRLQNREDIYFALFRPENTTRWAGNVKKYRVTNDRDDPIVDANGRDAIDDEVDEGDAEGFFFETAKSFWSSAVDGAIVDSGGAGEQINFARRMFGRIAGNDVALSSPTVNDAASTFLTATNGVELGQVLRQGETIQQNRERIARWTLGLDIDGERESTGANTSNQYVGDSLHGTPYVLSFGTDINNPLDVVFYTSNQGIVHAIDGDSGQELWSYVPDESLYQNLGQYYNNEGVDKLYGLDGEISFRVFRDPDTVKEIDEAVLFFGQRRGGDKVMSIDVTDARVTGTSSPVDHRWRIQGARDATATPGYERMGQTWAEPIVANVNYCDEADGDDCSQVNTRSVVFLSGGYDEFYDDVNADISDAPANNVLGNSVYMTDADTGELLWMVGGTVVDQDRDLRIPEMVHSIVAPPTVLDSDGNGTVDTLFISDISGQIFRVDFRTALFDEDDISSDDNSLNNSQGGSAYDDVAGGRIANFQEPGVNRRFYNPLSVTILPPVTNDQGDLVAPVRYAITSSSGYRAHPLAEEAFGNRIYVVYDKNTLTPQSDEEFRAEEDGNVISNPDYSYQGAVGNLPNLPIEDPPAPVPPASIINASNMLSINVLGGADDSDAVSLSATPPSYQGYYINLPQNSEKALNPSLITDFQLLAVTYVPSDNNASNLSSTCEAGLGNSQLYSFNLVTGETRFIPLRSPGISPSPVIVYLIADDGKSVDPVVIVGTEPILREETPGDGGLPLNSLDLGKANKSAWWEDGRVR